MLLDGTVVTLGGEHLDSGGYDLLGLITGSEGQLGDRHRGDGAHPSRGRKARARCCSASSASNDAGACVAAIIAAGIIPVAIEYMDRPAIQICEAFAHAGYPLDVEAMLIVEVEGSDPEIDDMLRRIVAIAEPCHPKTIKVSPIGSRERRDLEGAEIRLRRHGPRGGLHLHGRHHPDRSAAATC